MMKTTFEPKYLKIFFLIFFLPFFNTISYSQCAGTSNSSFPPICDKKTFTMGANPVGVVDLYSLLGGTPTPGGIWSDINSSGGLNTTTGMLNTWQINRGGVFTYRYTVTSVPGCTAPNNFADVTITLGGYPGVDDLDQDLCINGSPYNLFGSLGSNPNPNNNGTWVLTSGGPPGSLSGSNFNPQIAGLGTYTLTYTVPAVGTCTANLSSTVIVTVWPLPNAGVATPLTFCETDNFSAYTNVDLFGQLAGEDSGGFWADANGTGELSGSGDSVINIQNIATTFGPGTYTFTYTVDASHPVCSPATSSVVITIKPVVDLNGATLVIAPNICFSEIGTTAIIGTITQGVTPIADGTYNITYVLTGANTGTATIPVTFAGGVATFTVNSAFLTAIGTTNVEITTVLDPSTAPTNCTRTISGLNGSFIINENPNISDSQLNILDICLGQSAQGQISDINGPAIELSDGTYTVTFDITGPAGPGSTTVFNQTATVTISGGSGVFAILSALTPIDGNYTVTITNILNTVTNCSSPASIFDSFVVAPIPDAVTMSVTIDDVCDGENVVVTISGATNLTDGFYNITYTIAGAIIVPAPGQVQNNVQFTGGTSVPFNLPSGLLVIGQSTLTITNLFNSTSTCQTTTFTNPSDAFEIHAIPDANDIDITVADVCLGQSGTVLLFDTNLGVAPELTDGVYSITYDLTGANTATGQTATVNIVSGSPLGSFTIPASQLTNVGITNIIITILTNTTTGCDAVGVPIPATFEVLEIPLIDAASLSVLPVCEGQSATASISGATVDPGNYDLTYTITYIPTGINTVTGQVVAVVFDAAGNTTFNIPNTQIPNTGNYTITITNIVNNNTPNACSGPVTGLSATIIVNENPDTSNTTLSALDPVCLGNAGQVTLTDLIGTLPVGTYDIVYNLSVPNFATGLTATVTITSPGTGSFAILAASLTSLGNTTVTITSITNTATGCTSLVTLMTDFDVIPVPDAGDIDITVADICLGQSGTVQIFDLNLGVAPELTDGVYSITYNITGANTATGQTTTVSIVNGTPLGSFTIPASQLTNVGITNIVITIITNTTTGCDAVGVPISTTFEVLEIPLIDAASLSVLPVCEGQGAIASISGATVDPGNYDLTYNITYIPTGINTVTGQVVAVVFDAAGNTTFNIPTNQIPNSGNYTITITNIVNNTTPTACSGPVTGLSATILVNENPDTSNTTLSASDPVCLGSAGQVTLTDLTGTLSAGTYNIIYDLSAPNFAPGLTATVTITSPGTGSFAIPAALLTSIGNTTVTITSITNTATGCTSLVTLMTDFDVIPVPDPTGASLTVADICLGSNAIGILTAPALIVGNSYTLTYILEGALNSSTGNTVSIVYTNPNTPFVIPSTLLTNVENTPIRITSIVNTTAGAGNCAVLGLNIPASFNIHPIPSIVASEVSIAPVCVGSNADVIINSLGGLTAGTYQLTYSIPGGIDPSVQTVTFTVPGTPAFSIPSALLTSPSVTVHFISITNTNLTPNCSGILDFDKTFNVNPLPNFIPGDVTVADVCLGQDGVATITNATNLVDGTYTITYNLTGGNTTVGNQTAMITIPPPTGTITFAIPGTLLTGTSPSTVLTIVSITNNATGCSSSPSGIDDTFDVIPLPDTTGVSITSVIPNPICSGNGANATITSTSLADGTYTVDYEITNNINTNIVTGNTTIIIAGGSNTSLPFIIQASDINIAATYTISITTITSATTLCPGTSSSITYSFIVNPSPTLLASEVTIANICIGNNADVYINSPSGLIAGNYQLDYTITNTSGTSPTQTVAFTVPGSPAFSIPSALLTTAGATTINFISVTNTDFTPNCSSALSFSTPFRVNPLPTINPGEMTVEDVCLGQPGEVIILNATNLEDGDYIFTYDIVNGASSTSNLTSLVTTLIGGDGTFSIPASALPNAASATITITGILNTITGCSTTGLTVDYSFTVNPLPNVTNATVPAISTVCINTDVTVEIRNATALSSVDPYTLHYDLSGTNNSLDNIVTVIFDSSGNSSFVIPSTLLTNGGATVVTIQNLVYGPTACGTNLLALNPVTFTITDPQAPTLNTDGNLFCIQDSPKISNLTSNVAGSDIITWYNASTGGSAYNATDALVNGNTYYATLTDGNGCVSSTRLEVTVDLTACGDLFIPDGFSPNGDGLNEEFYIKDIELLYPNFELEIYNRYGNMVYKGNINTPRFNGKPNQTTIIGKEILPTGVYFYVLYYNDAEGTKPKQGRLYLSR